MIQSFEADATKALLELTARSVMSPLKHKRSTNKKEKRISKSLMGHNNLLHVHGSWPSKMQFQSTRSSLSDHPNQ